jgi:16S rRNA (adenine1518-N6/adenine1519-N6)-dimethyltransferase
VRLASGTQVGPGTGNLTKHLLAAGALVTAVEKDDTLIARLNEEYSGIPNLRLMHSDVLQADLGRLFMTCLSGQAIPGTLAQNGERDVAFCSETSAGVQGSQASGLEMTTQVGVSVSSKLKVVANLPYNITTDFLKALLPCGQYVSELHIMLQAREVESLGFALDQPFVSHTYVDWM